MIFNPKKKYQPESLLYRLIVAISIIVLLCCLIFSAVGIIGKIYDNSEIPVQPQEPIETVQTVQTVQTSAITTKEIPETTIPQTVTEAVEATPTSVVLLETEDQGQEYIDKIIFLGDSTTYGLKPYKMLTDGKQTKQVWTPTSGTLTLNQASFVKIYYPDTDTEITIKEAVATKKPEIMVITLGVNGVSFMDEEYFVAEYAKLVKMIQETSPTTKIMLQSMFPVAKSYQNQASINNDKIDTANAWILKMAEELGVKYLDTASVLKNEDGLLPEEYQNGDGMHLNTEGFTAELTYIRTHGYSE